MNALSNARLRTKLLGSLACVILLLMAVATLAFINLRSMSNGITSMYAERLLPVNELARVDAIIYKIRGDLFKLITVPGERVTIERELGEQIAVVTASMNTFRATARLNEETAALAGFDLAWAAYQGAVADVLVACAAGDSKAAATQIVDGGSHAAAREALMLSLRRVSDVNMIMANRASERGNAVFGRTVMTIGVVSVIAVILAVVIGIVLTRNMSRPLIALTAVAQGVAAGDLKRAVPIDPRKDEIGQLARAFRQMLENLRGFTIDISEGKRLEQELRTTSLYARSLIEAGLDPLVIISPEGTITDVNEMTERITGVSRERLIGNPFADYFTDPARAREVYQEANSLGVVRNRPLTIRHSSGRTSEVLYNISVYKNEAGRVQGLLAAARDVSESTRLERALQGQVWLKAGIARFGDVMLGDPDLTTLASRVIAELATYAGAQVGSLYLAETEGATMFSLAGSYAYKRCKGLSDVLALGEGLVGQAALEKRQILVKNVPEGYFKITSGLGELSPRFICVTPFTYQNAIKGVVELGTLNELTDLQMEYLNHAMPALAVAVESAQTRTNLARTLGESQALTEELRTQQETLRTTNEELEEQARALMASETRLKAQQDELQVTNEELEGKNDLLDRQKNEVEKARQDIEEQAKELALASKYKSEFLANMSHELRTPLNSLLLLAQSLSENKAGTLTEDEVESARIIHDSGNDLLRLINEILDLSKIEAGRMDLHLGTVRTGDLADGLLNTFKHMTDDKGIGLEVATLEDAPFEITHDRRRIEQIIRNLMSNAIKFTDSGSVTVTFARPSPSMDLSRSGLSPDECLAVAVKDTGIGIAPEKQRIIFEAFQQVDGGTARRYGGTGLGLSISRELARLLGGEIQVESELGTGSTFTLYLPVAISAGLTDAPGDTGSVTVGMTSHDAARDAIWQSVAAARIGDDRANPSPDDRVVPIIENDDADGALRDKRVLIVDDDMRTTFAMSRLLTGHGVKTLKAETGDRALRLLEEYPDVDLVCMDIMMPGMDGCEAMRRIRDQARFRDLPIIALTAKAMPEDREKCLAAGASDYLSKPVDQDRLLSMMRAWLSGVRVPGARENEGDDWRQHGAA
jgi:PAS domain S-box-containing protein